VVSRRLPTDRANTTCRRPEAWVDGGGAGVGLTGLGIGVAGLSNSRLEGLNSRIRLINHRGYGHHSAAAVITMIYLCCSGLTITLPTGR
jgi:hypothetical protein